jgi:hypothetical protein
VTGEDDDGSARRTSPKIRPTRCNKVVLERGCVVLCKERYSLKGG